MFNSRGREVGPAHGLCVVYAVCVCVSQCMHTCVHVCISQEKVRNFQGGN